MSTNFNPILPCEENEVVSISLTTIQESSLNNDFIPVVLLDKTYKEDGFKYANNKQVCSLSPYIEDRGYNLEKVVFDDKDEFVLRFEIKQGNSAAKDNKGSINAIGYGVEIISQSEFIIKYDQKILLRISKKGIQNEAYIDFYANDNDWFCYSVSNVHCGRVLIEEKNSRVDPKTLKTSEKGKDFIKSWEALRLQAYDDTEGYATIGYGHLIEKKSIKTIKMPDAFKNGITKAQAEEIFVKDLKTFEDAVRRDVLVPLYQYEFDALVSLLFNCGAYFLSAGKAPKLYSNLKNKKYSAAADEFADITNGGNTGLKDRRQDEINIFKNNVYKNHK